MNDVIHFNCHQCGGCCSQAPKVNFYEMLELQNDFIWQACHNIVVSTLEKPIDKIKAEQLQSLGHTIVVPEKDLSLFYYIDFQPIDLKTNNKCPKLLKDNTCSIYGRRPTKCRLSPFNILDGEHSQLNNVLFFKEETKKGLWGCSFKEKDPIIYSEDGFKNNNHRSLFYQETQQIRDFTDKFVDFLEIQDSDSKQKHFESLFDYSVNKKFNAIFSDLDFIFHMSIYYNIISEISLNDFISRQINLIDSNLNNKIDKDTNNQYKILKEKYSYFLENDYFSNLYS